MSQRVTFYELSTCSTCRKARKYLEGLGVHIDARPVRSNPPSRSELDAWIDAATLRSFLNTSSRDYRELGLSGRELSKEEALDAIEKVPNLIKRPVIVYEGRAVFGFKPAEIDALLKKD